MIYCLWSPGTSDVYHLLISLSHLSFVIIFSPKFYKSKGAGRGLAKIASRLGLDVNSGGGGGGSGGGEREGGRLCGRKSVLRKLQDLLCGVLCLPFCSRAAGIYGFHFIRTCTRRSNCSTCTQASKILTIFVFVLIIHSPLAAQRPGAGRGVGA